MTESKLTLKEHPTLADYQEYVSLMVKERGFDKESAPELFMLLMEECGEMAKAARKSEGVQTDENSKKYNLGHEAADVLIYLLDICNHYHVDLEKAFREVEEINKKRKWS
jgi:NTP pyrophosphatase (non-canonical NTP hydrolase)